MNKVILSALLGLFVSYGVVASASPVTNSVQTAINNNNIAGIAAIAAANVPAQGEIGLFLLQQAQAKLSSNPALAAQLFEAAAAYVAQMNPAQSASAATIIAAITNTANGAGFQSGNPDATSAIFAAALGMTNQPNIIAANSNLHATVLADANAYLQKNPQGANKKLKDSVSLAQAPGFTPTTNAIGGNVPSTK